VLVDLEAKEVMALGWVPELEPELDPAALAQGVLVLDAGYRSIGQPCQEVSEDRHLSS